MSVAIVDYGSGNLRSAVKAFERAARSAGLDCPIVLTSDPRAVARADRIVLPGVGAFGDCRRGLDAIPGMVAALRRRVIEDARPFLGICVGMQLMASVGHEHGRHAGLGWIEGNVRLMPAAAAGLKVPQIGWNELVIHNGGHALLTGIAEGAHAYFVHSYAFQPGDEEVVLASVDYGGPVAAVVGRDNLAGTQFHPEKSQAVGLRLIENFLRWRP